MKVTAEDLAKRQREISVSDFFAKNRHLLGFDNPTKALLTAVKEAVDNALDACEECGVLPDVKVEIKQLTEERFIVSIEDNGPGIVKEQIAPIFARLLYGSKFHTLKMARGQQGIGISAAVLYGQITTGKAACIISRTEKNKKAWKVELMINTHKNEPQILSEESVAFDRDHGTQIQIELEGRYVKGDKSVDQYISSTALANPHAQITYVNPEKEKQVFKRVTEKLPEETKAIAPHPLGVELGNLIKIFHATSSANIGLALKNEFCRVGTKTATEICEKAGVNAKTKSKNVTPEEIEKIYQAIRQVKIPSPPKECIAPIGEELVLRAMKANVEAEFYTAVTRKADVYRGNPFLIECGIAYGLKNYPQDTVCRVLRFANRVPLLYQLGGCAITKAIQEVDWRNYNLTQPGGSIPYGPILIFVHMASVWVPFTNEAKEAIAHYPEIIKEVKLALQEAGRRLSTYLNKKRAADYQRHRREIFERYIEEVSASLAHMSKEKKEKIKKKLLDIAHKTTIFEDSLNGNSKNGKVGEKSNGKVRGAGEPNSESDK